MSIDACSPIKTSAFKIRTLFSSSFFYFNLKDVRHHKSRKSYCGIYPHSKLVTWRSTRKLGADLDDLKTSKDSEFILFLDTSHSRREQLPCFLVISPFFTAFFLVNCFVAWSRQQLSIMWFRTTQECPHWITQAAM